MLHSNTIVRVVACCLFVLSACADIEEEDYENDDAGVEVESQVSALGTPVGSTRTCVAAPWWDSQTSAMEKGWLISDRFERAARAAVELMPYNAAHQYICTTDAYLATGECRAVEGNGCDIRLYDFGYNESTHLSSIRVRTVAKNFSYCDGGWAWTAIGNGGVLYWNTAGDKYWYLSPPTGTPEQIVRIRSNRTYQICTGH